MKSEVIYAWAIPSDHRATTYEVILRDDGSLSCPCPGWTFCRKGKPRTCKHVKAIELEARGLYERYQSGQPLKRRMTKTTDGPIERRAIAEIPPPRPSRVFSLDE